MNNHKKCQKIKQQGLQFPGSSFNVITEGFNLYGSDQEGNGSYVGRYSQVV